MMLKATISVVIAMVDTTTSKAVTSDISKTASSIADRGDMGKIKREQVYDRFGYLLGRVRGAPEPFVGAVYFYILLSGKLQNGRKIRFIRAFGGMRQLPRALFHLSSVWPLDPTAGSHLSSFCPHFNAQRARYTRVRRFSFFAFTSSPQGRKKLCISDLWVKASPLLPSQVKEKKSTILHPQNTLYQRIASEG